MPIDKDTNIFTFLKNSGKLDIALSQVILRDLYKSLDQYAKNAQDYKSKTENVENASKRLDKLKSFIESTLSMTYMMSTTIKSETPLNIVKKSREIQTDNTKHYVDLSSTGLPSSAEVTPLASPASSGFDEAEQLPPSQLDFNTIIAVQGLLELSKRRESVQKQPMTTEKCKSPTTETLKIITKECSENEEEKDAKEKKNNNAIEDQGKEEDEKEDQSENKAVRQSDDGEKYPRLDGDYVILGPNRTSVDAKAFESITWQETGAVTRQILGFVFTSDQLATHTLTGKPSPAFYGRERPPKMQLNIVKVADIIHCVQVKMQCSEREIRAAITRKCSDTSKKYKRQALKRKLSTEEHKPAKICKKENSENPGDAQ